MLQILAAVLAVALVVVVVLLLRRGAQLRRATQAAQAAAAEAERLQHIQAKYGGIADVDAERARIQQQSASLAARIQQAQQAAQAEQQQVSARLAELRRELAWLEDEAYFESYGLYQPKYDFDSSEKYRKKLEAVREQQKESVKSGRAASCPIQWTVSGSEAKGRKMVSDFLKLVLRAFNGECDAAIAKVRYNNVAALEERIGKTFEALNKLGAVNQCALSDEYLRLKLAELHLFHEYQEKLQAEKEEQRRIQEQIREEKQAQDELERAKRDAEKEEQRYQQALEKARSDMETATGQRHDKLMRQIEELQARLAEAQANKERAISRAQQTRSGFVYVISNIGSFGEHVYKIGMTRRSDPMDRVRELGDASVPFSFDVHAIISSEDAPALENALHRQFHHRRLNRVNERKEFFRVALAEIEAIVRQHHGQIEFTLMAEAMEYRQSLAIERGEAPQRERPRSGRDERRGEDAKLGRRPSGAPVTVAGA